MALSRKIKCDTCHELKEVSIGASERLPKTCGDCKAMKAAEAKKAHLESLTTLTVEERLAKIEEFIYDHRRSYHGSRPFVFG